MDSGFSLFIRVDETFASSLSYHTPNIAPLNTF